MKTKSKTDRDSLLEPLALNGVNVRSRTVFATRGLSSLRSVLLVSLVMLVLMAGCADPGEEPGVIDDGDAGWGEDVASEDATEDDVGEDDVGEDADASPSCDEDQELCDGACIDPLVDSDHCGSCGNDCGEDELCSEGACVSDCPEGTEQCDGECRDLDSDEDYCGGCDTSCGGDEECVDGECELSCDDEHQECDDQCVDTSTDPSHCGGCEVGCGTDEVCDSGSCTTSCGGNLVDCDGACVHLNNNDDHCGGCGNACPDGASCSGGSCSCDGDYTECGDECIDTDSDDDNCGSCQNSCDSSEQCVGGECEPDGCDPGQTDCDGACVDTSSDDEHCGGCDNNCSDDDGWYDDGSSYDCCDDGSACICQDEEYREYFCDGGGCDYTVTDQETDVSGCTNCGIGEVCSAGECESECSGDETLCGNDCVNTSTDDEHCGGCDNDCGEDDGWYDVGSSYDCCDDGSACICQDEEYREYFCDGGGCDYTVTDQETDVWSCTGCDEGEVCDDGSCDCDLDDDQVACCSDDDCSGGEGCQDNECVDVCSSDSDCAGGCQICDSGSCVDADDECSGDCETCDNGSCVNDNDECGSEQVCTYGMCTACDGDDWDSDHDGDDPWASPPDCNDVNVSWTCTRVEQEAEILDEINEMRSESQECNGTTYPPAPPLEEHEELACASRIHSWDMYNRGYFDHDTPEGLNPSDRVALMGSVINMAGENLASTPSTPVSLWMDSPGHCANIMNASYDYAGVGRYGNYWTVKFH